MPARDEMPSTTGVGVGIDSPRSELMRIARRLDIPGRSSMHIDELIDAIRTASRAIPARR
jgi:hypothetical protein